MNANFLFLLFLMSNSKEEKRIDSYFKNVKKEVGGPNILSTEDMKEFLDRTKQFEKLIAQGKCTKCITNYLNALSKFSESADEDLTDSLALVINANTEIVNQGCSKIDKKIMVKLKGFFQLAIANAASLKKIDDTVLKKQMKYCL